MDLLKAQLDRIQKQLAGLSASQKMLVAALAAIMVITVVWWGKYAGEAEMVPLLNQSFSAGDLGRIQDGLSNKGISFAVSGDKLLVPADRRMEALSYLTYSRLMPHDTQAGFDSIVKEMSPFDSQEKQQKIWNHGKESILSQIIGSFPGVAQADVIIDTTSVQRIEGSIEPSATVNITLQEGSRPNPKLVDAAAGAVSGAVAGINPSRIKVVVNGMAQKVHDGQDAIADGGNQLELLQQNEAMAERRVRQNFDDIPTLMVTVTMKLNVTSVQTEKHGFDPKNTVQKAISSTSQTETTTSPPGGGEAGTMPNAGAAIAPAAAPAGPTQSMERTEDKFQNYVGEEHSVSHTPAGEATAVSAAVRVPISYFARLWQSQNPSAQPPTRAQLQPVIDTELPKMRETVANCVALATPDKVSIDTFVDTVPTLSTPPVASASTAGLSLMVGGHAKEIALGTLAVMSLFMASMMVRKASPAPVPAAAATVADKKAAIAASVPVALSGEGLAGEAGEGEGHLEGMELNDDTIKAGRMVEQVSTLVRDDPDTAAALVKRWLGRS